VSGKIKWGPVVKGKVKLSITDTYGHFLKRWRNWKRGGILVTSWGILRK